MAYTEMRLVILGDKTQPFGNYLKEYAEFATNSGPKVHCKLVESIEEASKLIKTWNPNGVILDAYFEELNYTTVIKNWGKALSVIVTCDNFSADIKESASKHGAAAFLKKPEQYEDYETLIYELIDICEPDLQNPYRAIQ